MNLIAQVRSWAALVVLATGLIVILGAIVAALWTYTPGLAAVVLCWVALLLGVRAWEQFR